MKAPIPFNLFEQLDIRVGTILHVEDFPQARKPAYIMTIDFGQEIGVKKTSAQITSIYQKGELINRQIIAVVNFPPKQIANMISECLVLGVYGPSGVVLIHADQRLENGSRIG